jgi:hypothetical protein
MDCHKVFGKDGCRFKVVLLSQFVPLLFVVDESDVNPIPNVFHRFPEYRVVPQFEEVLLEVRGTFGVEVRIELDVLFQPWLFDEFYSPMYLG